MSRLTEALEQMERRYPSVDSFWRPKLSIQDIEQITADYPYQLPEEVVELYLWRNGNTPKPNPFGPQEMSFCFQPLPSTSEGIVSELLSLQKAMEIWRYQNFDRQGCLQKKMKSCPSKGIVLFDGGEINIATVGAKEKRESAPVYVIDDYRYEDIGEIQPYFPSLTNMILAINEIQQVSRTKPASSDPIQSFLCNCMEECGAIMEKYGSTRKWR